MKKITLVLAAFAMVAFAACNKDEKGYIDNGDGTVTINFGSSAYDNNDKQAFNASRMQIYFTTGDEIMVNQNTYPIQVLPTTIAGTPAGQSNLARVTTDAADNYEFYFTAATYTVVDNDYKVNMINEVNMLGNGVSSAFDANSQAWPMYAQVADLSTLHANGLLLLNAVGVLSPAIIYGPSWCDAAFNGLEGAPVSFGGEDTPCPVMYADDVVIRSNVKLTGSATLNKTNPTAPYIVMDEAAGDAMDEVICHVNPSVPAIAPTVNGQTVVNVLGNLPIAPTKDFFLANAAAGVIEGPTYQMDVYFHIELNGTTYYYKFETNEVVTSNFTDRSKRDIMQLNFQTAGNSGDWTVNSDGSITFGNGTLSAPQTTPFTVGGAAAPEVL